jgi:hypothetical protein
VNRRAEDKIEVIRAQFRLSTITALFVGESAPHSGDFFYVGNTTMLQHMRSAIEESALGKKSGDFLGRFKGLGWYLDDLVLEPVNRLEITDRIARCRNAKDSLAQRIVEYQPRVIVSLLKSIAPIVEGAAKLADSAAPIYTVPFPGVGRQLLFKAAMIELIPKLPTLNP